MTGTTGCTPRPTVLQRDTIVAATPLWGLVDFTQMPVGTRGRWEGEEVAVCPHCGRQGLRVNPHPTWQVFYMHRGRKVDAEGHLTLEDCCVLWPRTEYFLLHRSDGLSPELRDPRARDEPVGQVEELRNGKARTVYSPPLPILGEP
jgi:hypothetical protein